MAFGMFALVDWFRRRRALAEPFPEAWREIVREKVPFYRRLRGIAVSRFEDKLKVFARTKHFMKEKHPELYEVLRDHFESDPLAELTAPAD